MFHAISAFTMRDAIEPRYLSLTIRRGMAHTLFARAAYRAA